MRKMRVLLVLWLMLTCNSVFATPVQYILNFTTTAIFTNGSDLSLLVRAPTVGQQYYGSLIVDDAVLSSDGVSREAPVLKFYAKIDGDVWDSEHLYNGGNWLGNVLVGFRGQCYGPRLCSPEESDRGGLNSSALGLSVFDHIATELWGGVVGPADEPFIDFWGTQFNSLSMFEATAESVGNGGPSAYFIGLQGELQISRVPEPPTLLLLVLGAIGLFLAARGRSIARSSGRY